MTQTSEQAVPQGGTRVQITGGRGGAVPATVARVSAKSFWITTSQGQEIRFSPHHSGGYVGTHQNGRLAAQVVEDDAVWAELCQQHAQRQAARQEQQERRDARERLRTATERLLERIKEMDRDAYDHVQALSAEAQTLDEITAQIAAFTVRLPGRKEPRRSLSSRR